MAIVSIGIDVGQKVDPTAIAVLEVEPRRGPNGWEDHYVARFLERLPLGTSYPNIASRLEEIVGNVRGVVFDDRRRARTAPAPTLTLRVYADATGVGQPTVDVLRAAGVPVTAVYFTHGDRRTVNGMEITLGKAWLVSRLKSLFQTGRLHLPRTPEAVALERELLDYEIRVSEDANDRYGAFKTGAHDDLVTALGLAAQGEGAGRTTSTSYLGHRDDDHGPGYQWWNR